MPFETITIKNQSPEIRQLIVECIFRIVKAKVENIRSGWRFFFGVLSHIAKDRHEHVVSAAFDILQQILLGMYLARFADWQRGFV